jgi:hypothetical protein
MLFAIVFISLFVFVALLIFHYSRSLPPQHLLPAPAANQLPFSPLRLNKGNDSLQLQDLLESLDGQYSARYRAPRETRTHSSSSPRASHDTRDPLRVFDEL